MTMLTDELSGSCGDIVPMLTKANGFGRLFGATTGGWGGTVEEVLTLPASTGHLQLTRGLWMPFRPDGAYTDSDIIENVGVSPDVPFTQTLADFRAGYVGYFEAFNTEAIRGL
jgi:C-terminal processing protease CtpA/Prc